MKRLAWGPLTTIRFRLGAALALALAPVLILGAVQSVVAFGKDAQESRANLALAAQRSAATARARVEAADVLLQTLTPDAVGVQCAHRLGQVVDAVPGYANLIRFDAIGRVSCAAASTPGDPDRRRSEWFSRLRAGERLIVTRAPPGDFGADPSLLAAARAEDATGAFDGALVAVIRLSSLRPDTVDAALPEHTEVALADASGRLLTRTDPLAFANAPADTGRRAAKQGAFTYTGRDAKGETRMFTVAPLVGSEVFVVLSAPTQGVLSWAQLNPLSSVIFPLLSFTVALGAVWVVSDRVVLRWLQYLQRIAAIYARGRFTVRPLQADRAPPEIRDLADTLAVMAETIVARDHSLRDSLAQKDALMREIHHRVTNNLQVISSLINLQQRALADPAARAAMSDTRQRITALALIYRALYQGSDLKRVDVRRFLEELIAQLVVSDQSRGVVVRTELEADDLIVDPDKLAPLALFAVEAISNAQKHALAGRGGLLSVRFKVDGDEAVLEISDAGGGPPPDLEAGGVGRTLMTAFARQLRGQAELTANERGGVTARLVFPTPDIRDVGRSQKADAPNEARGRRNQAAA